MTVRIQSTIAALAALLLAPAAGWAQCAMCRTAVTGSQEGRMLAEGLNSGILLLLSVPFLLVGLFVLRVYLLRLRAWRDEGGRLGDLGALAGRTLVRKVGIFTLFWRRQSP